jgi:hypothetical protein
LLELAFVHGEDSIAIIARSNQFKEEIRHAMFLEDDLELARKWTEDDDKPRREARWILAFAVRHGMDL